MSGEFTKLSSSFLQETHTATLVTLGEYDFFFLSLSDQYFTVIEIYKGKVSFDLDIEPYLQSCAVFPSPRNTYCNIVTLGEYNSFSPSPSVFYYVIIKYIKARYLLAFNCTGL